MVNQHNCSASPFPLDEGRKVFQRLYLLATAYADGWGHPWHGFVVHSNDIIIWLIVDLESSPWSTSYMGTSAPMDLLSVSPPRLDILEILSTVRRRGPFDC